MRDKIKNKISYFSKQERILWSLSVIFIVISFCVFDRESYLMLAASLIGVTALIFTAKGHPFGQLLIVVFSVFYGGISFTCGYYGEMITYLGMTAPMAVCAMVSWLRHPYQGNRSEVAVNRLAGKEIVFMSALTAVVTILFYYILRFFGTANLIPSTLSVATSFLAVYLTARRSAYYALGYAANDIVLIVLWTLAAITDPSYFSVIICFAVFLANDIYGFVNWSAMHKRQAL